MNLRECARCRPVHKVLQNRYVMYTDVSCHHVMTTRRLYSIICTDTHVGRFLKVAQSLGTCILEMFGGHSSVLDGL